jgi:hypothetical protein
MEDQKHSDNVYALLNDMKTEICISNVNRENRGRGPGYFCMGCQRRLQAVLFTIDNYQSYFRHDAEAVKNEPKCTYSDETYRHKLGKEILQRLKSIRIPSLYKYSTDKENPRKYLLSESQFITASRVINEHFLYEDENGEICYSKDKPVNKEEELLIRPDVLFLDSKDRPILIIELVATHKPDRNKLIKLKRLGINAVQVRIPRNSPEAIEMVFKQTTNTHWIYNYVEENTEYLPISGSLVEGISQVDVEQKRFFEETFLCRSAQIRNLIRQIERLLESERYEQIVGDFESEIQRVEENTRREQQRLDELRDQHSERGIEKHSERRKAFRENRDRFQRYQRELEDRYSKKRSELEGESTTVSGTIAEIEFQLEELDSRGETTRYTIEEEQRAMESLGRQIEFVERDEEREREQFEQSKADIERETGTEEEAIDQIPIRVAEEGERLEKDFRKRTESLSEQIETTSFDEEGVRRELSRKYPQDREEYLDRISTGDYERKWYAAEFNALGKIHAAVKAYKVSHEEHSRVMGRN